MKPLGWLGQRGTAILLAALLGMGSTHAQVPAPAMSFELPALDGSKFVQLADYFGRPVLLNFWASECPPCISEMPMLQAQALRYPGMQFLGIAVDQHALASRFLARVPQTYPQLIAATQPEVLMRRFGNQRGALPYTVVLSAGHQVCASRIGEVDATWIAAMAANCSGVPLTQAGP
jgi:thiol-disulfide isomerase/thioredoxin